MKLSLATSLFILFFSGYKSVSFRYFTLGDSMSKAKNIIITYYPKKEVILKKHNFQVQSLTIEINRKNSEKIILEFIDKILYQIEILYERIDQKTLKRIIATLTRNFGSPNGYVNGKTDNPIWSVNGDRNSIVIYKKKRVLHLQFSDIHILEGKTP